MLNKARNHVSARKLERYQLLYVKTSQYGKTNNRTIEGTTSGSVIGHDITYQVNNRETEEECPYHIT